MFALERDVAVVDVRVPSEYAQAHIPGAKNVPIYQSITGMPSAHCAVKAHCYQAAETHLYL